MQYDRRFVTKKQSHAPISKKGAFVSDTLLRLVFLLVFMVAVVFVAVLR